ncbi:MAG TPA: DUF1015 domain-containing protein [bacterium]|nr:DUF1015 domain-containing protein [bacterium]
MAEILPFRGYRYSPDKVRALDDVIADPYDKIDDELREFYYEKSPHNIVRIIKGKTYPKDTKDNNQYVRAAGFLDAWIREGILQRDQSPCIYIYDQEYVVPGAGTTRTRKGFVALFRLMSYEEGGVKPHEQTLAGPKADRLNLMRATRAQFGQIFMLYPDPDNLVNNLLDEGRSARQPLVAKDRFSDLHKVWPVSDPSMIGELQKLMLDKQVFIADGHHRYETALAFRDEMRGKVSQTDDFETIESRMITFVSFDDPGLLVLPTHRLVSDVKSFDAMALIENLKQFFELESLPFSDASSRETAQRKTMEILHRASPKGHVFGVLLAGQKQFLVARLKDESWLDEMLAGAGSEEFRRLDVVILSTLILERMLGITKEDLTSERNVQYLRDVGEGVKSIIGGEGQALFVLNPTKARQVRNVASAGVRMPQKSTDFYPKLVTGLVLNKLTL